MFPENRLCLTDEQKKNIQKTLNLQANKKLIQSELRKENVFVTLKDLSNMKFLASSSNGDDLKQAVDYLTQIDKNNYCLLYLFHFLNFLKISPPGIFFL